MWALLAQTTSWNFKGFFLSPKIGSKSISTKLTSSDMNFWTPGKKNARLRNVIWHWHSPFAKITAIIKWFRNLVLVSKMKDEEMRHDILFWDNTTGFLFWQWLYTGTLGTIFHRNSSTRKTDLSNATWHLVHYPTTWCSSAELAILVHAHSTNCIHTIRFLEVNKHTVIILFTHIYQ